MSPQVDWTKFREGQNIWCKSAHPSWAAHRDKRGQLIPKVGEIYSIRELTLNYKGELYLRLNEIVNKPRRWGLDGRNELAFAAVYFEPVKEQNIEIFREMCQKALVSGDQAIIADMEYRFAEFAILELLK